METPKEEKNKKKMPGWIARLTEKGMGWYNYSTSGVWSDTRRNWKVNLMKTANLSVRSFLNADLQNRAASLTYQT
ncbi:MAG: hypothetical protein K2G84_08330, partial [Muribaculaceae bacterium]|nr:hypothetical protein [Muribaculaceae bacterium]